MKKRIFAAAFAALLLTQPVFTAHALTDNSILVDPVANTYMGSADGPTLIRNVSFSDVAAGHWAKEPITRAGALGLIRGDGGAFRPDGTVSNEEALAILVRFLGREQAALDAGVTLQDTYPEGTNSRALWSLGYLQVAQNRGLITADEFADADTPDQSALNPQRSFMRQYPATRERVAQWVSLALTDANSSYTPPTEYVRVKNFTDWAQIDVTRIRHVEGLVVNNIMQGTSATAFSPKGNITRAQFAQVLRNIDDIYYNVKNWEKKNGTVAALVDNRAVTTGSGTITRSVYIRTADGKADVIKLEIDQNTLNTLTYDAVVCGGTVAGLSSLAEGDEIEYIVDKEADAAGQKRVRYVWKRAGYTESKVTGKLDSVDTDKNQITITDDAGRKTTYTLAQGLLHTDGGVTSLVLDGITPQDVKKLQYGSSFELTISNNIVKMVKFVGTEVLENEIGGVVVENNVALGYITIFASDRTIVSKQYFESDMRVKKVEYYQKSDEFGYIAQMFPSFRYNPVETTIDKIEPGDVVFLRLDKNDPNVITDISASTNYVARYGRIVRIDTSAPVNAVLLESENKQTAWYDLVDGIAITKEGRMTNAYNLQTGDWVRLLLNQAIMEPGYYIESVKAMVIEGDAHYITKLVKGQLGGLDEIQARVSLSNYQELTKTGWTNYQELARLDISGRDTEIYMDGNRISLEYALAFLKRGGAEAYVALENNFGGERVRKITFRAGRDDALKPDTVANTTGNAFLLSNGFDNIYHDAGTIVVRNGRLVDGGAIMVPDYAQVAVNGENRAAVVSIEEGPDVSAPLIVRGRIQSVDQGKSFTVSSFSALSGTSWSPTPIQRVFTVDYNTKFYTSGGWADINTLIGYGADSAVNRVYTVLTDGSRAEWVFEMPYVTRAVRGTVYENDGTTIRLRNASTYNSSTGRWTQLGTAVTLDVTIPENGALIKSNKVADIRDVRAGDQLRVMTDTLPADPATGTAVTGYLTFVEY